MKKMRTILIFIYCSKNTFLRVLGPRLQIEIFDFPDYFFSNARTLTQAGSDHQRSPTMVKILFFPREWTHMMMIMMMMVMMMVMMMMKMMMS